MHAGRGASGEKHADFPPTPFRSERKDGASLRLCVVWVGRICYFDIMKIALAQIAPHLGNLKKNWDLHLEAVAKARRAKRRLVRT